MNDVANDRPEAVQTSAPEARLAAALHEVDDDGCDGIYESCDIADDYLREALYILAADPTLAADLALAAAVRGLPDDVPWTIANVPGACIAVSIYPDGTERTRLGADGADIPSAIEAAKEAERGSVVVGHVPPFDTIDKGERP